MKIRTGTAIYPAKVYADKELTRPARKQDLVGWMRWGHEVIAALWDEGTKNWIPAVLADRVNVIAL